ncbi:MAG TPA: YXWGXW repeat-containing protein [Mucilaginibacter sp.]|jgi:hypothetical protein
MKHFKLIVLLLFAIISTGHAQNNIPSSIFIIDPQSNTQVPANSENAILFKTSLINLVTNTNTARMQASANYGPGRRNIIVTQADPQAKGNAYQLSLQRVFQGQTFVIYTFLYSVDQNKLFFYDPGSQNWIGQVIRGSNVLNLNNCQTYGTFNQLNVQPVQEMAAAPVTDDDDATEVDTSVSVAATPPSLPDYEQPECPQEGYLWQPGYWAYSLAGNDYYWVPGVWIAPPTVGLLWTPPYWGFVGGFYVFHRGYWGHSIGFYGGIDYGYGYGGVGFVGGEWREGHFRYNTAIVRVNVGFHNVYVDRTVYHERSVTHYSFNGRGGYMARPNTYEMAAVREHHIMATHEQIRNQRIAREDRTQFASHSEGRPMNLAAAKAPERRMAGSTNTRMGTAPVAFGARPGNMSGTRGATNRPAGVQGTRPNGAAGTRSGSHGDNRARTGSRPSKDRDNESKRK